MFLSLQIFEKTFSELIPDPKRVGVFSLIIPAFSKAILSKVFPNIDSWSISILVIMESSGFIMLVESNLPPSPVSIILISVLESLKNENARAVLHSKKEGLTSLNSSKFFS